MTTQSENNSTSEYMGISVSIVFLAVGLALFFGWENFGNEMLVKFISIPFVFIGVGGLGTEIEKKTNDSGASDLGIGLAIIFSGLILGSLDFKISLNLLVLIIVGFGAIPVVSSIIKSITNEHYAETNIFYRSVLILGQLCGSILAIIEFVQFFTN